MGVLPGPAPVISTYSSYALEKRISKTPEKFGTGVIKVTPGHDATDFEIGRRHNLPIRSVIGFDGKMTALAGKYAGLDRFECRKNLWADMERAGLTLKTEPYELNVPRTQRGGGRAAVHRLVAKAAKERGCGQLGTLGSGNHFIEVDVVDEIFDATPIDSPGG